MRSSSGRFDQTVGVIVVRVVIVTMLGMRIIVMAVTHLAMGIMTLILIIIMFDGITARVADVSTN